MRGESFSDHRRYSKQQGMCKCTWRARVGAATEAHAQKVQRVLPFLFFLLSGNLWCFEVHRALVCGFNAVHMLHLLHLLE